MRVGFIGLGTMGSRLASNLLRHVPQLHLYDISAKRMTEMEGVEGILHDSLASVFTEVDLVFLSLPGPPEVRSVIESAIEQVDAEHFPEYVVDLSTNSPTVQRELGHELEKIGCWLFDAPVSGGPHGAASKNLAVWVGGPRGLYYSHIEEYLQLFARECTYVGPLGSGSIVKLVHNGVGNAVNLVLAEVFAAGVLAGVRPADLWRAVRQGGTGRRRTFDRLADNFLVDEYEEPRMTLDLARKDALLAREMAREVGIEGGVLDFLVAQMDEAVSEGFGHWDSRVVMKTYRDQIPDFEVLNQREIDEIFDMDPPFSRENISR